ncbi:hypothetical protein F2Q70_00021148 [Brassica cretica]|uniref:Uncharacterized protein n=1 Tax=Brassica cretica TaxID=69181 RepID=A0A8S9GH85_BRACR|nr:hypothetical protein F2Q70_00021148 [Brassica cretica]
MRSWQMQLRDHHGLYRTLVLNNVGGAEAETRDKELGGCRLVLNNVGGAEAETRDKELGGCRLQHGDYLFPQTVPSAPTTRKLETTSSSHVSTSKPSGVRSSSVKSTKEACNTISDLPPVEAEKQSGSQSNINIGCNCVLRHRQRAEEHHLSKETHEEI